MCQITNILHGYPKKHGLSIDWISSELWNQGLVEKPIPFSTLQAYLSPNHKTPFPAYLLVPFCRVCNNDFSALDMLEVSAGRTAFDIPKDESIEVNHKSLTRLINTSNTALTKLSACLEDGVVDEEESEELIPALFEHLKRVSIVLSKLTRWKPRFKTVVNQ